MSESKRFEYWPRYEDDELVLIGDAYTDDFDRTSVLLAVWCDGDSMTLLNEGGSKYVMSCDGKDRVRYPER